MDQPRQGRCNAKETRKGKHWFCGRNPAVAKKLGGNGRCRRHGGLSLKGEKHGQFKHGLYMMREDVGAIYEAARADPELGKVETKLAIMELLLQTHLQKLKAGTVTERTQDAILAVTEQVRRLIELRDKQQERLRTHIPAQQVQSLARALTTAVVDIVKDPVMLQQIQGRFRVLMRGMDLPVPSQTIEAAAVATDG